MYVQHAAQMYVKKTACLQDHFLNVISVHFVQWCGSAEGHRKGEFLT
jgi:hypothetical protein